MRRAGAVADRRAGDVDDEVDDDDDRGEQHDAIFDDENVAIGDRLKDQSADPRQGEDILHDNRPGDQIGELQAHDRKDRRQGVGQGVAPEDRAARQAFGAGGADEVFVQDFEQRRSRDASQDRRLHQAERDRRKDQCAEGRP
jgi:hypothetical protein